MHHSKVRGVTLEDRQGTLKCIAKYSENQIKLFPEREPNNPFDPNAIKIMAEINGNKEYKMLGYFSKEITQSLAPIIDAGGIVALIYEGVVGLKYNYKNLGCLFCYVILT